MTVKRADLVRLRERDARDHLYVVSRVEQDDFTGVVRVAVHPLLPRLYEGRDAPPRARMGLVPEQLERLPTPAEALEGSLPLREAAWPTRTRQSIERLFALWLLHEDRKRLLDASTVDQLAHQISLLDYIKHEDMRRLLIADEVGLGKTIEAGLVIDWVLRANPAARVLYLAPAMLVDNVYEELRRMELPARIDRYSATISSISNEHLRDGQVVVASIHKASYDNNFDAWRKESGAWDLMIVDECHHLADWSRDGGDPKRQMRLIRDLVERRLHPEGRLVLMSATPHQGNENKFRNLLRLLSDEGYRDAAGSLASVSGRVVYRTKEDVRAWDGEPLFSRRKVNEPTYVELGDEYGEWLEEIARVFEDAGSGPSGWRKAQALQWAASSPKAGLAYLARLAVREGWDFGTHPLLRDVAKALLPYRHLPADADEGAVRAFLRKQTGLDRARSDTADTDDAVDDVISSDSIDQGSLERALQKGIALSSSDAMRRKMASVLRWLDDEAPAKFVIFATPVETVDELRRALEEKLGAGAVVSITGALQPHERRQQMHAFRGKDVRVLVASRAGSEGINLQVAHRLVHFDVPWNPMEMEQRVGRVHRYGSTQTVVVDTIVAKGSREERMLKRCRARLAQIIEQLFGPESEEQSRFEEMYGRVMTQVPSDQLAEIVADEGFMTSDGERLDALVQSGFEGWRASDEALRDATQQSIASLPERGQARPDDVEGLFELLGAVPEEGWHHIRLVERDGERVEAEQPARVFRFLDEGSSVRRVADGLSSLAVRGPAGFQGFVERAGLNTPGVAAKLRELVGGAHPDVARSPRATSFLDGAGTVRLEESRWNEWRATAGLDEGWEAGGVLLVWSLRLLHRGSTTEAHTGLRMYLLRPDSSAGRWLSDQEGASILRQLWAERGRQNLVVPPHQRAGASPFVLEGLAERAALLTREAVTEAAELDQTKHDFEVVPLAALTLEPRPDDATSQEAGKEKPDSGELTAAEAVVYLKLDSDRQPPGDFIERVYAGADDVTVPSGDGDQAVYALLLVDPSRLDSLDPKERALAFGVYVGMTKQDVMTRFGQHQDPDHFLHAPSLSWQKVKPVGVLRLDRRFEGLSDAVAAEVERDLADALRRHGLRVLGGH